MIRLVAAVAAALSLAACGPDAGNVIGKGHDPARTDWIVMQDPYPCGQATCFRPRMHPIYHAECWRLDLDTGQVCVSRDEWDDTEIGAVWSAGKYEERAR